MQNLQWSKQRGQTETCGWDRLHSFTIYFYVLILAPSSFTKIPSSFCQICRVCLVQQSACSSEPVPLQGVPPLKPNINCRSPVNRNAVFITPLFTCPRGGDHRLAPLSHSGRRCGNGGSRVKERLKRGEKEQRTLSTGKISERLLKELGIPLSLLFSFASESNFLLSDFFLFCPSESGKKKTPTSE